MKMTLLSLLVAATVLAYGVTAYAYTAAATMNVSATCIGVVTVSATDMNFGTFLIGSVPGAATSSITVTASSGLPYAISLDAGQHYNGLLRNLEEPGGSKVAYRLDSAEGGPEWGDYGYANTFTDGDVVLGTGTGAGQSYTVYGSGLSYAPRTLVPGFYNDVVTVTVNY